MKIRELGVGVARRSLLTVALCMAVVLLPAGAWAQSAGSAFTYQGQLKESGMPAEGAYDFVFVLFDGDGVRVSEALHREDHPVSNGLFDVVLDFGTSPFTGDARFLEIGVRRGGSGDAHTPLSPRQELTPIPYATKALETIGIDGHSLDAADGSPIDAVYVDNAGNVGIGRTGPSEKLDVAGTVVMTGLKLGTSATPGHLLTASASGVGTWQAPSGGGSTPWNVDGEDNIYYGDGNVGIGLGSGEPPLLPLHVGGNAYFADRIGIGTTNPTMPLHVAGDARVYNGNLHLGADGFDPYIELMSDESSDATEMRLKSLDGVGFAVTNSADTPLLVVEQSGDVGIGLGLGQTPSYPLHVVGDGQTTVYAENNAPSGVGRGVYGRANGTGGRGVVGIASASSGVTYGVQAECVSPQGYAVYAYNECEEGNGYAVHATTTAPDGTAIRGYATDDYGQGVSTGVLGQVDSNIGRGVYGKCNGNSGRGVLGEVTGTSGFGVYGQAVGGTGVHGEASSTSGGKGVSGWVESETGIGVFGQNDADTGDAIAVKGVSGSAEGYGGYFEGRGYFSREVSADGFKYNTPQERYLTLPIYAFRPTVSDMHGSDPGWWYLISEDSSFSGSLMVLGSPAGDAVKFAAPVYLPDVATVTQLTAYALDAFADADLYFGLYRVSLANPAWSPEDLALASTSGSSSTQQTVTGAAVSWPIDNSEWSYYVTIGTGEGELWDVTLARRAVRITYVVEEAD